MSRRKIVLLFLFLFLFNCIANIECKQFSLQTKTGLEKYLKPALNKCDYHHIRNVNFIYMINLDQRPQKFELSCSKLHPFNIYPYRFSAVNGWELSYEVIDSVGVKYEPGMNEIPIANHYYKSFAEAVNKDLSTIMEYGPMSPGKTYFAHGVSVGTIGISLSHLSILQDAYDSGYQTIWVMEDDIEVVKDPNIISDLIDKLDGIVGKSNWDVLFTDQDTKGHDGNYVPCFSYGQRPNFTPSNPERFSQRVDIGNSGFRKIGARYGAYSMILRRSGIKKILQFIKQHKIFLPYDLDYTLPNGIKLYTVTEDVVTTLPNALTDNSVPYYQYN